MVVRQLRVDPARLESFALTFVPAVLAAARVVKPWTSLPLEDYAVGAAVSMVEAVQRGGVACIEHYVLNSQGRALEATCATLGIEVSIEALQNYIGGRA
jgi:hypothetical protein